MQVNMEIGDERLLTDAVWKFQTPFPRRNGTLCFVLGMVKHVTIHLLRGGGSADRSAGLKRYSSINFHPPALLTGMRHASAPGTGFYQ